MKCKTLIVYTLVFFCAMTGCEKDTENTITIINKEIVDYVPDITFCQKDPSDSLIVDVNVDNHNDLFFRTAMTESGALGHYITKYTTVNCLTYCKVAVSYEDGKFLAICSDSISRFYSDTIIWTNDESCLAYYYEETLMPTYKGEYGLWNNKSNKYLHVRNISNNDTLYGWIKLSLENYHCLSINEIIYEYKSEI